MRETTKQKVTFGVVGGYGATGRVVVSELLKSSNGDFLVGGRDPAKLESITEEFGSRVSAAHLDVLDASSLDAFCSRCSIIVNCGGPVMILEDRVAQAAFRAHCHYVDPAGMGMVRERLLPHDREIADLGLSFVVSAGWMPGIIELLPIHACEQAKARMDSIDSVSLYFTDSGEWSENALLDGVWYLRRAGLSRPGYFRKGEWVRARMSETSRKVDLGGPIGLRNFGLYFMPELNELGRRFNNCDFFSYGYVSGFRNVVAAIMLAVLPLPQKSRVRLLRGVFRRNRLPVAGLVMAEVAGHSQGRRVALQSRIVFEAGRDYWMNGVAMATVARMISQGKGVTPGVHFLFGAVDPVVFMAELRKSGINESTTLKQG